MKFLEDILGLGPSEAGIIGSIPHLVMAIVVPCGGVLADRLRTKKILSPTNVRKVMNCGGFGTEAFFLLVLSYTKTRIENVGALIIAVGSSGLAISGEELTWTRQNCSFLFKDSMLTTLILHHAMHQF